MRHMRLVLAAFLWIWSSMHGAVAQEEPAVPACTFCTDKTVACPTCDGTGVRAVPCVYCGGDGAVECGTCDSKQPGWIDCPNGPCRDGKTHWQGGDTDPCKLCATKGRIPCPSCRGQKGGRCVACAGIGKRMRTCWTCVGGKRLPCPKCTQDPAATGCGTCDGSGKAPCRLCAKTEPKGTKPCLACDGKGDLPCARCQGLDRVACAKCAATGKMRMASSKYPGLPATYAEKAGVKTCDLCEGRAVKNCADCKKGRIDCAKCEKGQVPDVCVPCLHQRQVGCDECLSGGHARHELLGNLLLEKGEPVRAAAFLARALEIAQTLKGPAVMTQAHIEMLDVQARFDELRKTLRGLEAALGEPRDPAAATPPAAAQLEQFWPQDMRERHWPDAPAGHALAPWRDETWLAGHRARLVARLTEALAKANAAAGK